MKTGKELRLARLRAGVSICALARVSGMSRQRISRIEIGPLRPEAATVRRLLDGIARVKRVRRVREKVMRKVRREVAARLAQR